MKASSTNFRTADLSDKFTNQIVYAAPIFNFFGLIDSFYGEIITVKLFEDNSLVRKMLSTNGKGKVLVIDGGASLRCALIGDQLAELIEKNYWEGVIVNGCIRDSKQINQMEVGIRALNTSPLKSIKRNKGELNIPVEFANIQFKPRDYIYVDADGIIVSEINLLDSDANNLCK